VRGVTLDALGALVARTAAVTFAMTWLSVSATAQTITDSDEAVVLVTTYADGRAVHDVVTRDARSAWTPLFPKVASAAPVVGPAVAAVKYVRVLQDDGGVRVAVSVLRGQAHEKEERIAMVIVRNGEPIRVDALAGVGVAPITLTLAPLLPTTLPPPLVRNQTAGLEIASVEVPQSPAPSYQVTVKNVSSQPAVNFHFATYLDDRLASSGNRGNPDSSSIVSPQGTYTFTVSPARIAKPRAAGWSPTAVETIEIAAVLWENGDIEGDAVPMATALSVYLGRAEQLTRGMAILQGAREGTDTRAELRRRIERLSHEPDANLVARLRQRLRNVEGIDEQHVLAACRTAMASARSGMLDDLREAPKADAELRRWLVDIVATYETWRRRLSER
jgi:hypothetical protein